MKKYIIAIVLLITTLFGTAAQAALTTTYTPMDVPIRSTFKTYEPIRMIASNSAQGRFIADWVWIDENGFARCGGETDLGIPEDYYLVAMGSYYAKAIGEKFRIALDTGRVIYVAIGDYKANCNTNSTNQWGIDNRDILEFIVNDYALSWDIQNAGSCNVFMPLNGAISTIEKISFVEAVE